MSAERIPARSIYFDAAEQNLPSGSREEHAQEAARLAVEAVRKNPGDTSLIRVAASAARQAARIITRANNLANPRNRASYIGRDYNHNPSWQTVVSWPKDVPVSHTKPHRRGPSKRWR